MCSLAIQEAAGVWCTEQTKHIVMDVVLATAFAEILQKKNDEIEQLRVQLAGCLTAAEGAISKYVVARQGDYGWSLAYQRIVDLFQHYEEAIKLLQTIVRRNGCTPQMVQMIEWFVGGSRQG